MNKRHALPINQSKLYLIRKLMMVVFGIGIAFALFNFYEGKGEFILVPLLILIPCALYNAYKLGLTRYGEVD